ncbi:MAG TPA: hypothetical protein PLV42_07050 [bacterium]|nr:hypothetical protein [bacterium]
MKKQKKWCMECEHRFRAERHCRIKQTEVDPFGTCKKWKKVLTYKQRLRADIRKVPLATKQQILDLGHAGKTIGEIAAVVNLDSMVIATIFCDQTDKVHILRREARP